MKTQTLHAALAAALLTLFPLSANAQEALLTPAATFPAKDRWVIRQQLHTMRFLGDDTDVRETRLTTSLTYGVDRDTSLSLRLPLAEREDLLSGSDRDDERGLDDISLTVKRRLWQEDSGAYGSSRLAAFAGVRLPTGTGDLSSDSVDPSAGLVYMTIRGRHGLNVAASYTLTTSSTQRTIRPGGSSPDLVQLEAAYLYRLAPETYSAQTKGSWYLTAELDVNYETNGDRELILSPGLLYEARRWAFEVGLHVPTYAELDDRPELDSGFVVGWRYLF